MLALQDGTYEDTAVYPAIQHPEPQRIHGNTSTKLDRTTLCICSHAPVQIGEVQARSPDSTFTHDGTLRLCSGRRRDVRPRGLVRKPSDSFPLLYEHQAPHHTCVTSATSLSSPLSMAARDLHVTSTLDLCCALLQGGLGAGSN